MRLSHRGRKAHRPFCRVVAKRGTVEVDDDAEFCTICCPLCVVCLSSAGRPLDACPHSHGVCSDCMRTHLEREARAGRLPQCPCGEGEEIDLRRLPEVHWRTWTRSIVSTPLQNKARGEGEGEGRLYYSSVLPPGSATTPSSDAAVVARGCGCAALRCDRCYHFAACASNSARTATKPMAMSCGAPTTPPIPRPTGSRTPWWQVMDRRGAEHASGARAMAKRGRAVYPSWPWGCEICIPT